MTKAAAAPAKPRYRVKAGSAPSRLIRGIKGAFEGSNASFGTTLQGIAQPYETAANDIRMPIVGNPGPIALAAYNERNRSLARHLYRTDGLFKSAFDTLANAVVGTGPVPRTKFRELIPLWRRWCKQSDPTGMLPFGLQIHHLYRDSELVADGFARIRQRRKRDGLVVPMQLQLLEAEYLPYWETRLAANGNRIICGVEVDDCDRRVGYHMYRAHPNDFNFGTNLSLPLTFVDAEDILHLATPARMGGLRGEGRGVAGMVMLWMLHSYLGDEAKRKKLVSRLAAFIKDTENRDIALPDEHDDPEAAAETHLQILEWAAGDLIQLPKSTEVQFPNIVDTSGSAGAYLKTMGMFIAAAIGVPYELMSGDWSGVNDRTAVFQSTYFDLFVETERNRIQHQVIDKVWERFVDYMMASGQWEPPEGTPEHELYEVSWSWPARSYRHPVQEIDAKVAAIKAGIVDRWTVMEELGYDPVEVDLRQAQAMLKARLLGLKLTTHEVDEDGPAVTEATERLTAVELASLEKLIAEIEGAVGDHGILDE